MRPDDVSRGVCAVDSFWIVLYKTDVYSVGFSLDFNYCFVFLELVSVLSSGRHDRNVHSYFYYNYLYFILSLCTTHNTVDLEFSAQANQKF